MSEKWILPYYSPINPSGASVFLKTFTHKGVKS
jgi:hypothetical protein